MIGQQRELPRNIEAEAALIGAVLLKNDAFLKASAIVTDEHFFEEIHANVWAVLSALIGKGQVANPILLKTHLGNPEIGEGRSLLAYLTDITMAASSNYATAESYARTVRDTAMMRDLIVIGGQLQDVAYEAPVDMTAEILFAQAESKLEALRPSIQTEDNGFADFDQISTASIYEAYQQQRGVVGLSTGLVRLDDTMNGLQDSDLIVLAGRPGMGKAQPLNAAIKTIDGWTTMGEVRLGQQLASPDGRYSIVTGIFPQGVKPIFEVAFSDGRKARACGEHLWRVRSRHWEAPRVLSTDAVRELLTRKRHQGRLSIDLVTGDFGRSGQLPLDPWLLGLILGNGRVDGSIRLTTRDEENLDRAERLLPSGMCIVRKENGTHSLRQRGNWRRAGHQGVVSNPIAAYLHGAGLPAGGCHTMFVPAEFMSASRGDRMALLQGLMDSNGYVETTGSVRFCTSSPQLARDVESLVRSLGGLCRVRPKQTTYSHKGERRQGRIAYVCLVRHPDAAVMFANSEKCRAASRGRNQSVRLTIASIDLVGSAEAQCIRVSHPDSLYVTDDYVVTHNTALATGVAVHVAKELRREGQEGGRGGVVGIFSLEMSSERLKHRIVSDMASVQGSKLAKGLASAEEMQAFHDAERELRGLPLKIDDRGGLTIAQVKMRARSLHRRQGLRLLVVDYLQLLSGTKGGRDFNRTQEVTEITTGLKALAKELKIPVIALSQLSRDVEKRDDKRPQMSDLRESGSIEQDADAVLLVFREEYYHRNLKPREEGERLADWARKMERIRGVAEVNVTKNRHGGDGIVELGWHGEFTRFTNDPPWRVTDPEEARQKAKSVALTKHGSAMRDIMKELAVSIGQRPSSKHLAHKAWLPHTALLIVRDEVKEEMRTRVLGDLDDKEFRRAMQAAADNLRHAGLTQVYKDEDEIVWIYLVEIIGE